MVAALEQRTLTGQHFMNGDMACAEGALAVGCSFFAGYPITPSTEIAERLARRLPKVGGRFIQTEDELASMAAVLGASWAGATATGPTSGPGFGLRAHHLGNKVRQILDPEGLLVVIGPDVFCCLPCEMELIRIAVVVFRVPDRECLHRHVGPLRE